MIKLKLSNVVKQFGRHTIINGINLEIKSGEFAVIVGPSGCGKSTLLRMIAGLEEVTTGTIVIDDKIVNQVEPKDRNIAMVFQHYALYPHMSVYDNMAYGLKIRGYKKSEIFSLVARAAVILQLDKVLDRKPHELSGGQRQRVAMGRAMVRQPSIFLFDEPLSNLDSQLKIQMRHEIRKLQKENRATTIYVTHDQVEAMTLADKLIVMNKGEIQQVGTPEDIYKRPANFFVASFFGFPSMNFFTGTYHSKQAHLHIGEDIRLPMQLSMECLGGTDQVTVGVRPDSFVIAPSDQEGIELQIDYIETLGPESFVYGNILTTKESVVWKKNETDDLATGEIVRLMLKQKELHLYRKKDGLRIN